MSYVEVVITLIPLLLLVVFKGWQRIVGRQTTQRNAFPDKRREFKSQKFESYPQQPFNQSGRYHMTMGLRKLDLGCWLTIDKTYLTHQKVRTDLLANMKPQVLQCLPGSEDACTEVLDIVVDYLTTKYPAMYRIVEGNKMTRNINNIETGEVFNLNHPFDGMNPLEIAARLVCEDLNVLKKIQEDGNHHLVASATLFPVGWSVEDRIGWRLSQLHGTVPSWQAKLEPSVERFFSRITVQQPMERSTFFVQVTHQGQTLSDILCQLEASGNAEPSTIKANDILVRRERQTFKRLPRSDTVLFTVKTTVTPLVDLAKKELIGLSKEIASWPADVAMYKGRHVWGSCVMRFCGDRLASEADGESNM